MKKKLVSMLLAFCTCLSFVACGNTGDGGVDTEEFESTQPQETSNAEGLTMPENYDEDSSEIYNLALKDFYESYQQAKASTNVSEKFALEAIAEAKLLGAAVIIPTITQYGDYGIQRVAPYTSPQVLWGTDNVRYHDRIVCEELITKEDFAEIKQKWAELKGTGTYEEWVKQYLTDKGYTLKDTYTYAYSSDPVSWDVLATSEAVDSEVLVNTYDGLLEYDMEGVQQPALAESYEVSDDGLTYTFHLRSGVKWVDSQGREVADVKADDFVAGMQHLLDAKGGLDSLLYDIIKNARQYGTGEISDFSEVGVAAPDDNTVVYTLDAPCSYLITMVGYSIFAPMSRTYYESQGGKFGVEFDSSAADYTYGKDADSIAYCGPYLVTSATEKNSIVYKANESYWNAGNININTITWLFSDGSDPTKLYNDALAGTIDGCGLTVEALELAKEDGNFDKYTVLRDTNATSYCAFFNLNRNAFHNFNDHTVAVSSQTEEDKTRTNAAVNNVHFRRALFFAFDRASYNAQSNGEELKLNNLRNTYTPGNFVTLEEDVTVDINGTATTFAAGTYYGEIIQAQLDADNIPIVAWNKDANDGIGSSDGYDGWRNLDNAKAEMETAISELAEAGVTIDADNPIHLDVPYPSEVTSLTNQVNVMKQSIESAFDGAVVVDLVDCITYTTWGYSGYYTSYGYESNYDLTDQSGWMPDYGDPSSYLDTYLPEYEGYMGKALGIY
ncbi:MAG: ABC transporter substrate-binding protein [Blautia sp.]|nr:ABC transporter substrate-binding protein [Blautia sp.]